MKHKTYKKGKIRGVDRKMNHEKIYAHDKKDKTIMRDTEGNEIF